MNTSSLYFIEPPYAVARRFGDAQPALGSVALFDTSLGRLTTNELKVQMDVAPWCPMCLLTEPNSGMRATRRLGRTCVVFGLDDDDGAAAILKAVATRPRPTPSDMVEWLTRRTKLPTIARTMVDLFTRPLVKQNEVNYLPYAVREQLRLLGDWSALEWQRAASLAELAADRSALNTALRGVSGSAEEVRSNVRELLGMGLDEFVERYGWEWVLEASLRRSGFVDRSARGIKVLVPRPTAAELHDGWGRVTGAEAPGVRRASA